MATIASEQSTLADEPRPATAATAAAEDEDEKKVAAIDDKDEAEGKATVKEDLDADEEDADRPVGEKGEDVEKAAPPAPAGGYTPPPDGGLKAWANVLGAFLVLFCTFGYLNAFGVYESYYLTSLPAMRGKSSSEIAWIGSFQLFLQFAQAPIAGFLFSKGYFRIQLAVGSAIYAVSVIVTSECNTYAQFFAAQGLGMGLGNGVLFLPAVTVLSHHFARRRGLAMGIAVSGSSIGGICFPIMLNKLFHNPNVGFKTGVRASGYLVLGCLVIANLIMSSRYPPGKPPKPDPKAIVKDKLFWTTAAGMFFVMWGLFLPFFYLQVYLLEHGVSQNLSFYSLSILNGASFFGRTIPNAFSDRIGVFNVLIPASLVAGILIFVWLACANTAGAIVFALLFGFSSGAYVSLLAPLGASTSRHHSEIGLRMGMLMGIVSIAALTGTPICGAILSAAGNKYWAPSLFAGISVLLGCAILAVGRRMQSERKATWKV